MIRECVIMVEERVGWGLVWLCAVILRNKTAVTLRKVGLSTMYPLDGEYYGEGVGFDPPIPPRHLEDMVENGVSFEEICRLRGLVEREEGG